MLFISGNKYLIKQYLFDSRGFSIFFPSSIQYSFSFYYMANQFMHHNFTIFIEWKEGVFFIVLGDDDDVLASIIIYFGLL